MKQLLEKELYDAVNAYCNRQGLDIDPDSRGEVERTRDEAHGDFATNVAMVLAKRFGVKPRDLAQGIAEHITAGEFIQKTEIAGPGFINFYLRPEAWLRCIPVVLDEGENYGRSDFGNNRKILIEFVSTNPTGPLHVGHGRGAAYGAALANLLSVAGFIVTREYYVNDAGRQMDILATSVWLRYLQLCGLGFPYPENGYQGDYIKQIAEIIHSGNGNSYAIAVTSTGELTSNDFDKEREMDRLIRFARENLGDKGFSVFLNTTLDNILASIRDDLAGFEVEFDNWFSERSLIENKSIDACLEKLDKHGDIYDKDGARWFLSSKYGDEKDRVIIRENGQPTYFATDIAYHVDKFNRDFDACINIWGADHHGYINRIKGALQALDINPEQLHILIVQFAALYRGKEKVQMSTRSGEYVTLKELIDEIGKDAARFFYVTRKSEQHLDFDLELAKSESNDNPVYYIQYAHARICSVLRQMQERGYTYDQENALANLSLLAEDHESKLIKTLSRYPEVIYSAAETYEPHLIAFYLRDVATDFHAYYNSHQFLVEDARLRQPRISLALATRQVLKNGLSTLGVSAPEEM